MKAGVWEAGRALVATVKPKPKSFPDAARSRRGTSALQPPGHPETQANHPSALRTASPEPHPHALPSSRQHHDPSRAASTHGRPTPAPVCGMSSGPSDDEGCSAPGVLAQRERAHLLGAL